MSELRPLTCVNCGGKINEATMTCQFCGTEYQYDEQHRVRLVHSIMRFQNLEGMVALPSFFVHTNKQVAMEDALHQIAEQMVEHILPLLEYREMYDPACNEYRIYARAKVGIPNTGSVNVWDERR